MTVVLHLLGVFLLFSGLGALALGGDESRKLGGMTHGIGLLLILVTGLVAMMGLGTDHSAGLPGWIYAKLAIWLLMGAAIVALRRAPGMRVPLFFALPLLGSLAAWLAFYRPG
ncbi:MAG: hypothetical protein VYE73_07180 [Acidobacteriota bacterium]|nr:hypothetical protein [Acidobacteriota bacterium]